MTDAEFEAPRRDYFKRMGFVNGVRDKRDVTYQRPLTLEDGVRW